MDKELMVAMAEGMLKTALGFGYWTRFDQPRQYVAPTPGTFLPGLRVGDKVFDFDDDSATLIESTVVYMRDGAGYIVDETSDKCTPTLLLVSQDYRSTRHAAIQHWRKGIVAELYNRVQAVADWQAKADNMRALLAEEHE
jgi:hypothetical protein